jgi:hypothetical protein
MNSKDSLEKLRLEITKVALVAYDAGMAEEEAAMRQNLERRLAALRAGLEEFEKVAVGSEKYEKDAALLKSEVEELYAILKRKYL